MFSFDEYRRSRPFAMNLGLLTFLFLVNTGCATWGSGPPVQSPAQDFDDLVGRNVRFHMSDRNVDMKVTAVDYPVVTGTYIDASYSLPPTLGPTTTVDLRTVEWIDIHHSNVWKTIFIVTGCVGMLVLGFIGVGSHVAD